MELPVSIFLFFIGLTVTMFSIGLWKKIPLLMFVGGAFLTFWSIQTDTIIMDSFASGNNDSLFHYNVESRTGVGSLNNVNFATAEFVSASNSALVGDTINCIGMFLSQTGNPVGTATIGILDSSNPPVALTTFGTINVATLTNAGTLKTFCLSGDNTYTIKNQDRIGITYNGAGVGQTVGIEVDANNPFDGTITFRQFYTGGAWSSLTGQDNMGQMYLTGSDLEITDNTIPFTEYPKILFGLVGAMFLISGALIWKFND